ncbi:MAG: hypothetical protein ACJ75H_11785 [Thermoanaerobaculia bacterium]
MSFLKLTWTSKGRTSAAEPRVFTDYVRSLAAGEPQDERRLSQVWKALAAGLRAELKRRGLWESPPFYLGIFGWERWEPERFSGEGESALEELLAECYTYIFIDRLRSLQAQLKAKPNIDGLVFLNIRHFLHERQKEHDPIGSQVFEVLQSGIRQAIETRELQVIEGDERVRNDTVLAFRQGTEPSRSDREKLSSVVARWNDELLPDLITARGRRQAEVVERLCERLRDLPEEGIEAFRFKDLVDPLKADVRARWAALLERAEGRKVTRIPGERGSEVDGLVLPDTRFEEREVFRKLVDCVLTGVRRLEIPEKTRGYLTTLWQFLRVQASEGVEAAPEGLESALGAEMEDEQPSLRQLAEQLRIPRERLPGLYDILRDLLNRCRAAISGEAAVRSIKGSSGPRDRRRPDDH